MEKYEKPSEQNDADKMNREYKDSVFVDLFKNKKYLLDLYRHLHPEDTGVTEDDLEAAVITNDNPLGGVLSEYMNFVAVVEEQVKIYGRNEKAIKEAIKICKDKNILREYLEKRESEVMNMLDGYYSQEDVTNMMLREAEDIGRREGEERGRMDGTREKAQEVAIGMASEGISLETIARVVKYPIDTIKIWVNSPMAKV